jgi:hypothetical protein
MRIVILILVTASFKLRFILYKILLKYYKIRFYVMAKTLVRDVGVS